MRIKVQKFTEFGKPRRVHRHVRAGVEHSTLYVLWRSRKGWLSREIFTGQPGAECRRTVVLRVSRPCPPGTIKGCVAECMGIGASV